MIERRIGLLFACFLLLLCLAIGRAAWVQGVQGGGLERRGPEPAHADGDDPGSARPDPRPQGQGAGRLRGRGDVVATPYQVEDPAGRRAQARPRLLHVLEDEILERSLADRSSGFAYLAREVDLATAEQVSKLDLAGIGMVPRRRRIYPEGKLAAQVIGTVGTRQPGPDRARGRRGQPPAAPRRRARR